MWALCGAESPHIHTHAHTQQSKHIVSEDRQVNMSLTREMHISHTFKRINSRNFVSMPCHSVYNLFSFKTNVNKFEKLK